jgi:hypothetical protein
MEMINRGIKLFLSAFFVMLSNALVAQDVRVKATANKDHILVGEPVLLQLEAECPADASIGWFNLDSIPHFEFIDKGKIDTVPGSMGKMFHQTVTVTSYDSGSQVFPQMAIALNNRRFVTDSFKIEVSYSAADPNQPYHDIKEIVEVPEMEPLYVNYIIAVLTIIAIVALVLLLRRKGKVVKEQQVQKGPMISPYEKAVTKLTALSGESSYDDGNFKQYCIGLNDIFRDYCRDENIGASPDSNNSALVIDLKPRMLNDDLVKLAQALRLVDAVKFAKYRPAEEEYVQVFTVIRTSIDKIHQQVHPKTFT